MSATCLKLYYSHCTLCKSSSDFQGKFSNIPNYNQVTGSDWQIFKVKTKKFRKYAFIKYLIKENSFEKFS